MQTGIKVAIKIINKARMQQLDMHEKVRREIDILRKLRHPHVIRLYELIDTPTDLFMVMEYAPGGELFDYIVSKSRLTESEARRIFQQIAAGVEYCHNNMICHRDLKPENILLDANGHVKVADFGLSNLMQDGDFLRTSCGSPNYASPEVISGKAYVGPEIDAWSSGVILYALLCGALPFEDEVPRLFKRIKQGAFSIPGHLSEPARHLITRLLTVDPAKRLPFRDIKAHPWVNQMVPLYLQVSLRHPDSADLDQSALQEMTRLKIPYNLADILPPVDGRRPPPHSVAYSLISDALAVRSHFRNLMPSHLRLNDASPFARQALKRAALLQKTADRPGGVLFVQQQFRLAALENPGPSVPRAYGETALPFAPFVSSPVQTTPGPRAASGIGGGAQGGGAQQYQQPSPAAGLTTPGGGQVSLNVGGGARWRLGLEAGIDGAVLMTAVLRTLRALRFEWFFIHQFKLRCRPKRPSDLGVNPTTGVVIATTNSNGSDPSNLSAGLTGIGGTAPDATLARQTRPFEVGIAPPLSVIGQRIKNVRSLPTLGLLTNPGTNFWSIGLTVSVHRVATGVYSVDTQVFEGPCVAAMSTALLVSTALYSTLKTLLGQNRMRHQAAATASAQLLGAAPQAGQQQLQRAPYHGTQHHGTQQAPQSAPQQPANHPSHSQYHQSTMQATNQQHYQAQSHHQHLVQEQLLPQQQLHGSAQQPHHTIAPSQAASVIQQQQLAQQQQYHQHVYEQQQLHLQQQQQSQYHPVAHHHSPTPPSSNLLPAYPYPYHQPSPGTRGGGGVAHPQLAPQFAGNAHAPHQGSPGHPSSGEGPHTRGVGYY